MEKLNLKNAAAFGYAAFIRLDRAEALYEELVERLCNRRRRGKNNSTMRVTCSRNGLMRIPIFRRPRRRAAPRSLTHEVVLRHRMPVTTDNPVISPSQQLRNRRRALGRHMEINASNQGSIITGIIQKPRRVILRPLKVAPLTVPLRAGSIQQSLS